MSALVATVERLRRLRPEYPDSYAPCIGVPPDPGWTSLADAAPQVAEWCAQAREQDNPARLASVAATTVGGALVHAVLGPVTAALVLGPRASGVRVGDPYTEVVPDLPALLHRVAADAVATLRPLLDAVRAATRYGLVPLWNSAADAVRSAAHYVPLYAGVDRERAERVGAALVEALTAQGARLRDRGGQERLEWGT